MAERHRSKHGGRDTDQYLDDAGAPAQGGRDGGDLSRAIGSEDERKRAEQRPAGTTRVRKADEDRAGTSNLGDENR
jgi:hypothetical protein